MLYEYPLLFYLNVLCNFSSVRTGKHGSIDSDMANQNLGIPRPSFPMAGSQQRLSVSSSGRSKVGMEQSRGY